MMYVAAALVTLLNELLEKYEKSLVLQKSLVSLSWSCRM